MLDFHTRPDEWGVLPYINIFELNIGTYEIFVILGLVVGGLVFINLSKQQKRNYDNTVFIFGGAFVFGVIGAKLPIFIVMIPQIVKEPNNIMLYLSGRTVVGGLIGGMLGVLLVKKLLNIKEKRGNLIAPAVAVGIAIGRIGCYFRGCCYGVATKSLFGTDFGDGVLRHPTQLYEFVFHSAAFIIMMIIYKKVKTPGILFKIYAVSYFTYRFFSEFIRIENKYLFNLSAYQYASIAGIILLILKDQMYKRGKI